MHMRRWQVLLVSLPLTAAGLAAVPGASAAPAQTPSGLANKRVCAQVAAPAASCAARVVVDASGKPLATTSYSSGYAPADLAAAYNNTLPAPGASWLWNGQTVGIVDAYRNLNAAADLAAYRSQFGLPACPAGSCFTEMGENGPGSALPAGNTSWGQEIDLDLEMVSATCPMCKIVLVDGNSASLADLGTSVNTAVSNGATAAVSNSYGASEFRSEGSYGSYYNHPGTAITVSSGDGGYGVEFPAALDTVTAVGGTSLSHAGNTRGWSETVWSGAGSGCSAYVTQQSYQAKVLPNTSCSRRVVTDVAAVADPNTGVAVYDSYGSSGGANWFVFGGTSVASPIIASFYAQAKAAGGPAIQYSQTIYSAPSGSLNDVTSGSNGRCTSRRNTSTAFLCTGEVGYDGPTGMGTPYGLGAF
jgi:subtilase family serine protease